MIEKFIIDVPDFPKPGIIYKDITPLLADCNAMQSAINSIANYYKKNDIDLIVGTESRGFIFGIGVSMAIGKGFVPIRKPGKLPRETYEQKYELEYGSDTLEIHQDAIKPGQKVLIVDDLLATGGTMDASIRLAQKCGAEVVGCSFIIELAFLDGREKIQPIPVRSLIKYDR